MAALLRASIQEMTVQWCGAPAAMPSTFSASRSGFRPKQSRGVLSVGGIGSSRLQPPSGIRHCHQARVDVILVASGTVATSQLG